MNLVDQTPNLEMDENQHIDGHGLLSSADLLAVSYGYGTNSTAMLCGFKSRGIRPEVILAADTGAEMPHSYEMLKEMNLVTLRWWGVPITVVKATRGGDVWTLEQHCLKTKMLPSLAYGKRSCSQKFKHQPMEKWLKQYCREHGKTRIIKAIGYDTDEFHRVIKAPKEKKLLKHLTEVYWYPLLNWQWRREDCERQICSYGITQPRKSACYFCPASKPSEVIELSKNHPELAKRALDMETAAQSKHRKLIGLGGEKSLWADWIANEKSQIKLMDIEPMHKPCGCTG